MFKNVLFLEKRGCNFTSNETCSSDVKNYRVCTHGETIPGKDGNMYFLEFSLWRDRKKVRYTHKITGKPLKHPVFDIINRYGIHVNTEFTNDRGSWANLALEKNIHDKNYNYTVSDILKIVNEISREPFDRVIFADSEAIQAIPHILKLAGYREKNIIDNLNSVDLMRADKDYIVYRFNDVNGNYFEYEKRSGRITN